LTSSTPRYLPREDSHPLPLALGKKGLENHLQENEPSFIRVLPTDKGTVDAMLIDGVEMYGRFFTCETDQTPVPPVKIANPPSELAEPLKKKGTHPYLHL
jgi:hypothetical protein